MFLSGCLYLFSHLLRALHRLKWFFLFNFLFVCLLFWEDWKLKISSLFSYFLKMWRSLRDRFSFVKIRTSPFCPHLVVDRYFLFCDIYLIVVWTFIGILPFILFISCFPFSFWYKHLTLWRYSIFYQHILSKLQPIN